MAYKFQVGPAQLSGSLKRSGSMDICDSGGTLKLSVDSSTGNLSGSGTADFGGALQVKGTGHIEGACTFDSTVVALSSVTAGTSFIIGSADLNESDMEQLDGITKGTAAANKAMVTDASNNIASLGTLGCGAITSTGASSMGSLNVGGTLACDTSFTLDAITVNATELGYIDGVTAGTVAASKALVLDASKDIGTIRNLTIDGTFSDGNYTFDTSGNVTGLGTVACGAVTTTGNVSGTTLTGSTAVRTGGADLWGFSAAGAAKFAAVAATSLSASSTLSADGAVELKSTLAVSGTVKLGGVADTAIAVADDSLYFLDADGLMKSDSFADIMAAAVASEPGLASTGGKLIFDPNSCGAVTPATGDSLVFADATDSNIPKKATLDAFAGVLAGGTGIAASGVALSLDLNELSAASVNVAADSIAIIDADDSNASKKESIVDLASAMAGSGVTATNGVFSVDTTGGDSMSAAAIADGGTVAVGLNYLAAITANATVTLPAAPAVGDICVIKAHTITATHAVRVQRGHASQTIDGLAEIEIRSSYGAVTLIAATAGNSADWRIA